MESASRLLPASYASDHIRLDLDLDTATLNVILCPRPRPCVSREILEGLATMIRWVREANARQPSAIRHMILQSDWPGVFSLGGDLKHFVECIEAGERELLTHYAIECVRIGHVFHTGFNGTVSTTSVIAGHAMGGGLEGAAACQTIICEEGSTLQLPEMKFGMFPGMGAVSYLSRRAPGRRVRDMIESGDPIDVKEAYDIRLIDELVPRGCGIEKAYSLNRKLENGFHGRLATRRGLALAQGPALAELEDIAHSWVDVAFKINARDRKLMLRLASHQLKLSEQQPAPAADINYDITIGRVPEPA